MPIPGSSWGADAYSERTAWRRRDRQPCRSRRCGAAVVEFAVCLPLLVAIVLGAIEACSMIALKQALQTTAYEAVRVAVAPNGTSEAVLSRANEMLLQRNVRQGAVTLLPSNLAGVLTGDPVTVTVTAPIDANRLIPRWFFGSGELTASCVMLKEGYRFRVTQAAGAVPALLLVADLVPDGASFRIPRRERPCALAVALS